MWHTNSIKIEKNNYDAKFPMIFLNLEERMLQITSDKTYRLMNNVNTY